ncbi:MAG: LD-carboxypeptidase [Lachnospiraceae bacterium]|nr:LD-carboxypeptidase [Lachnospiraceae bacterium]
MIYPKFLVPNDTIGITAPSGGCSSESKAAELDLSEKQLRNAGYRVVETPNSRLPGVVSSSGEVRAKELADLYNSPDVKAIICARGGDFLIDMLPYVDYELIKNNPKWIQGYSDPTSLLYSITTKLDIATIYSFNGGGYGFNKLDRSHKDSLSILRGDIPVQESYPFYQGEEDGGLEEYIFTEPVEWEILNTDNINVNGRLIGGCMECLADIIGTPYEDTTKFIERYKEDGFIWYFDIFALRSEIVYNTLWHMKAAGWFNHAKAIIFGRVRFPGTFLDMTYQEAVVRALPDIPLIFNADVGHVAPRMTMINGSLATLKAADGKGSLAMKLL